MLDSWSCYGIDMLKYKLNNYLCYFMVYLNMLLIYNCSFKRKEIHVNFCSIFRYSDGTSFILPF